MSWYNVPGWNTSTTNPDTDRVARQLSNMAEGLCPNGCEPLRRLSPNEVDCPACGFTGHGGYTTP